MNSETRNWEDVLNKLETGEMRTAQKIDGRWVVNEEVKICILEAFKAGQLESFEGYVDKHTIMPREFSPEEGVRIVPRGTAVRRGSYLAKGVVIMPPAYVNIGAYVDSGTMIDSHALVGSCAQIGKNVHLSAGVQIGGVLEPIGLNPVIIEDNVFLGANSCVLEGRIICESAVIAPGTVISRGTPIYDTVNETLLGPNDPIPARAVVVPGSRPMKDSYQWAKDQGLQLNCGVIIKYRDEKSDASLELEKFLR